ncbi:hypothetical protein NST77_21710 [Niallia sp. FSL W8-0177]
MKESGAYLSRVSASIILEEMEGTYRKTAIRLSSRKLTDIGRRIAYHDTI